MTIWTNNDGLRVKFARDEAVKGQGGEYETDGAKRETIVVFDYTDIGSSAAVVDEHVYLPAGARIERVDFFVDTAFTSGGSATLDLGTVLTSTFSTEQDYNGLIAAAALATINAAGKTLQLTVGSTGAGALIGTTLAAEGCITVNYNTAAFTAGKGRATIFWSVPHTINT
jgi:hypothetical protein